MNEAEWDHIECRQSLSYDWIYRNYHIKQRSFCWRWVQLCYDVSYVLYESCTEERRETKEDWGVLSQHDWYWKILTSQKKTDSRTILFDHYHKFLNVFDHIMTEKLSLLRKEDTDHQIKLKEVNRKESKVFWDSLYNMTREKLLVLQKTLTELFSKQFIWVSNSFAAVSVLFIQKSEDELWFCVNYCDLNWITQKNYYFLLLIYETLQNIKWAQWYIKLNVIVAFHKIWIAAEDEWKMTFCTRYELYEWMMISFELVNVSSTFQRYINWVLKNFLNEFCSVYVNNILIFTDESLHQHQNYIWKILLWL